MLVFSARTIEDENAQSDHHDGYLNHAATTAHDPVDIPPTATGVERPRAPELDTAYTP